MDRDKFIEELQRRLRGIVTLYRSSEDENDIHWYSLTEIDLFDFKFMRDEFCILNKNSTWITCKYYKETLERIISIINRCIRLQELANNEWR